MSSAHQVRLCRVIAALLGELADSLEADLPAGEQRAPGRPRKTYGAAIVAEVLRVRHANGRLGALAIAERVGLTRYAVEQILAEHAAAENPSESAEKPSASRPAPARSTKANGPGSNLLEEAEPGPRKESR